MRRRNMIIALFALSTSAPAWSSGDGDLWILPAAVACVAQYPELSSTYLGTALLKAPQLATCSAAVNPDPALMAP